MDMVSNTRFHKPLKTLIFTFLQNFRTQSPQDPWELFALALISDLILGFGAQARCISDVKADTDHTSFLTGTLSLKEENEVLFFESILF